MQLTLSLVLLTLTSYRSVPEQTDNSPFYTSIGHRVSQQGAAISTDLLASGTVCYGDVLLIPGIGARVANDVMNPRHKKHIDIWVATEAEEAAIGWRNNVPMTVIQSPTRRCKK